MPKGKGNRERAENAATTADEASGLSRAEREEAREPREGLQDERSLKDVTPEEDEPTVDESSGRAPEADDLDEPLGLRSEKDGGYEGEELPTVRVGEVYEAMRPDDHRRYVKILSGRGGAWTRTDGKVLVQNEETYHNVAHRPGAVCAVGRLVAQVRFLDGSRRP
jgi:hypothetical protein